MINIFKKPKDKDSTQLIKLIKKDGVCKVVKTFIDTGDSQYLGPFSNFNVFLDEDFDFLDLDDRIALDYINRVGINNKNLTDTVWTKELKMIATYEIFLGIRDRISSYSLGRNLEKKLLGDFPENFLEKTAHTEITYESSHSKIDILLSEVSLFSNAKGYVKIKLSPIHKEKDICDYLQGTYKIEDAPITPFHFDCYCILRTFMDFKNLPTTTIEENLKDYSGGIDINTIETVKITDNEI